MVAVFPLHMVYSVLGVIYLSSLISNIYFVLLSLITLLICIYLELALAILAFWCLH